MNHHARTLALVIAGFATNEGLSQTTQRVSVDSAGQQAVQAAARPSLSGDGNLVSFDVPSLTDPFDGIHDVFVRDLTAGQTFEITAGSNGACWSSVLSDDGNWVVFYGNATNLDPSKTTPFHDVFVADISDPLNPTFKVVSRPDSGIEAAGSSMRPDLSAEGRHIVFQSSDSNLVPEPDTNLFADIFVHDRDPDGNGVFDEGNGHTSLISKTPGGTVGNNLSWWPTISGNGRFVAFESLASDLVPGDTNNMLDIFVRDRDPDQNSVFDEGNEVTVRVSVASDGTEANNSCLKASLNHDGRYVAWDSNATNLASSDGYGPDVFVHDRDPDLNGVFDENNGITTIVSVDSLGNPAWGSCQWPRLSADGTKVAFYGTTQNLTHNPPGYMNIYVHDRTTQQTYLASVDSQGHFSNGDSGINYWSDGGVFLSADGSRVAFYSFASNLIGGDTNGLADIFVHDVPPSPATELGYGKVGGNGLIPTFSVLGELTTTEAAEFRLRHGPASQSAWLFPSLSANPTPKWGGTIVPLPLIMLFKLSTDADGEMTLTSTSLGVGPLDVYMQWVFLDPMASYGIGISNALKVTFRP